MKQLEEPVLVKNPITDELVLLYRTNFATRIGIDIPTNDDLKSALQKILYGEKGDEKWLPTLPEEVRNALLLAFEEGNVSCSDDLHKAREIAVQFCYTNAKYYSDRVISSVFAVIIINTALLWAQTGYTIEAFTEDMVPEDLHSKSDYLKLLGNRRDLYELFDVPLECIAKAYFRGHDMYWHNSELSVLATNAILKVMVEIGATDPDGPFVRQLGNVFSAKYYSVLYGKEGHDTPARKEYQKMLMGKLQLFS